MLQYYDTWASVGCNENFKVILSLAGKFAYIPYQFEIETAFLNGEMDALVYVKQDKGYEANGKESWVWRLRKSFYGEKQAPRMWKSRLTSILKRLKFPNSQSDEPLFINSGRSMLLHVHVDDRFVISKSEKDILTFLNNLNSFLKLKFKKKPTQYLGYNLDWTRNMLEIDQVDLIAKFFQQFKL
ncbi:hypothetical protein O181_084137 [Austropuccinia psidii MF-1]|uniref:Reverse transcriptase Ty1/copia-type domain-containing protein n=1 Tax=Austropuccinia psidii MF-1 TaxID=1389203 RepID=A0A9Q3IKQ4_9BASI|nr:hypothetical protein [Austropuccinia psidii MF-1]